MNLRELEKIGQKQGCFSLQQLRVYESGFLRSNLVNWMKKGYIKRISKGWYTLSSLQIDERMLFFCSNKIYSPSYVSIESALRYYDLIPEGVFMTTACSTKKTQKLSGDIGNFYYYNIKSSLFWGYEHIKNNNGFDFLIASVEKTICDFFYLKKHLDKEDIAELRIDRYRLWELTNQDNLRKCAKLFKNKRIIELIEDFISYNK
ncbi:MAG TPA: hypothetical protein P5060_01675 [Candidatus Absconditabacterales bacterium]|nr:hypothetical protein [Candidatus Absconditabacterales bacterium]